MLTAWNHYAVEPARNEPLNSLKMAGLLCNFDRDRVTLCVFSLFTLVFYYIILYRKLSSRFFYLFFFSSLGRNREDASMITAGQLPFGKMKKKIKKSHTNAIEISHAGSSMPMVKFRRKIKNPTAAAEAVRRAFYSDRFDHVPSSTDRRQTRVKT